MKKAILSLLIFLIVPFRGLGQYVILHEGPTPTDTPAPTYEFMYIKTGMGNCAKLNSGIEICGLTVTPPAIQGAYFVGFLNTGSGPVTVANFQIGFTTRTVTGSSDPSGVVYSDCYGGQIQFTGSGAATEALPDPSTLNNSKCGFGILNATTGVTTAVTVTPASWTINGTTPLTIAQNEYCWIYVDDAVSTNWDATCHATTQRP